MSTKARMSALLLIAGLVLFGCRKAEKQPAKPERPEIENRVDRNMDLLLKRIALQGELDKFALKVVDFSQACSNLESIDWDVRKCASKKRKLLREATALQAKDEKLKRDWEIINSQAERAK